MHALHGTTDRVLTAPVSGSPHHRDRSRVLALLAPGLLVALSALAQENGGSYSYFSLVEGGTTVIQAETGTRSQAELNLPLLAGDRLWVAPDSRSEVVLSDYNRLRLDGDSEVEFDALAFSPDQHDEATVLHLARGRIQLVVVEGALGEELPRIRTHNATIYIQNPGTYLLTAERESWTHVVVRSGFAEVVTERGSTVVRTDEEASIEGATWPHVQVQVAGSEDAFERWGEDRETQLAEGDVPYVDEPLRYSSAPLAENGEWVEVEDQRAWRPHVEVGWRPYWRGRWVYTPSGLTWVSSEPWGWVPYHYGTWNHHPHHGWIWYPGSVYAPAHVYWYWGPQHVAWIPRGYYTHHYRHYRHGFGFRSGVYGYAGGSWNYFRDWIFCPTPYFGRQYQYRYQHDGSYLRNVLRTARVPRGIITTDTRRLTPQHWQQHDQVREVLENRLHEVRQGGPRQSLPDVTPFLARQPKLDSQLEDWLLVNRDTDRSRSLRPVESSTARRVDQGESPGRTVSVGTRVPTAGTVTPQTGGRRARGSRGDTNQPASEVEEALRQVRGRGETGSPSRPAARTPGSVPTDEPSDPGSGVRIIRRPPGDQALPTRPSAGRTTDRPTARPIQRPSEGSSTRSVRPQPRRPSSGRITDRPTARPIQRPSEGSSTRSVRPQPRRPSSGRTTDRPTARTVQRPSESRAPRSVQPRTARPAPRSSRPSQARPPSSRSSQPGSSSTRPSSSSRQPRAASAPRSVQPRTARPAPRSRPTQAKPPSSRTSRSGSSSTRSAPPRRSPSVSRSSPAPSSRPSASSTARRATPSRSSGSAGGSRRATSKRPSSSSAKAKKDQ